MNVAVIFTLGACVVALLITVFAAVGMLISLSIYRGKP